MMGTGLKKEYKSIKELIERNLDTKEDDKTQTLIDELRGVAERGCFTKGEFLKMGMWKSPRPKNWYLANSEDEVVQISKEVFSTEFEKRRIDLLTRLQGVSIPTASAILTLTNPKDYGVIDIRVWEVLYLYGSVLVNPTGTNFSFKNWYKYLMKIRYFAKIFDVKTRDIERTIFLYHFKIQEGRLYERRMSLG
jgi:hypothetical protein